MKINLRLIIFIPLLLLIGCDKNEGKLLNSNHLIPINDPNPMGDVGCSTVILNGPNVTVSDLSNHEVSGARVGFVWFVDGDALPENNGACNSLGIANEYDCVADIGVFNEFQSIKNSSIKGHFGISIEKQGFQTKFVEIANMVKGCAGGFLTDPQVIRVILE